MFIANNLKNGYREEVKTDTSIELSSGKTVYYTFSYNEKDSSKSNLKIYNSFEYTRDEQEEILKAIQARLKSNGYDLYFNISKMKNEWGWHTLSYALGYKQLNVASVDVYINADDESHGVFSLIMNKISLFG